MEDYCIKKICSVVYGAKIVSFYKKVLKNSYKNDFLFFFWKKFPIKRILLFFWKIRIFSKNKNKTTFERVFSSIVKYFLPLLKRLVEKLFLNTIEIVWKNPLAIFFCPQEIIFYKKKQSPKRLLVKYISTKFFFACKKENFSESGI